MNSPSSWALLVALVMLGLLQAAEAAGGQRRGRPLGEAKLELLSGTEEASSTSPTSATKRSALEEGDEANTNFFHQPVVQYSTSLENGDGGEAEDTLVREKRGPTIDKPVYIPMDTRQNTAGTMLIVRACACMSHLSNMFIRTCRQEEGSLQLHPQQRSTHSLAVHLVPARLHHDGWGQLHPGRRDLHWPQQHPELLGLHHRQLQHQPPRL